MTHQEIKELAGHRAVPPWIMKLVCDAVTIEREECAKVIDSEAKETGLCAYYANLIRARGEK